MFDAQQFAARLANRQDRWSPLKEFIAEWYTPLQDGDGYSAEEIDAAEGRVGRPLPVALREIYRSAGRRLRACNDPMVLVDAVQDGMLTFWVENQYAVVWMIPEADLHLPDPPVYVGELDGTIGPVRENGTLSEFVTQKIVQETACFGGFGANASADQKALETVREEFVPLGFPDWHWPVFPARLYGGADALLQTESPEDGGPWLWIGARSQDALRRTVRLFDLEWESLDLAQVDSE